MILVKIIRKLLTYVSHSVLSIYPLVIHSTNVFCTPTWCRALHQPLGIWAGTIWMVSVLMNLTLKSSEADNKQTANI